MDSPNPTPPPHSIGAVIGVKFFRYRALLQRHWWVLAITIGIGLLYQSWRVFNKPDLYESNSELMVREETTVLDQEGKTFKSSLESLYGDTMKMLQSAEVLNMAKERVDLEAPNLRAGDVHISVNVTPRTSIFTVTGTGTNPEYTQRFVDAVVTAFVSYRKNLRRESVGLESGEVAADLERTQRDLAKAKKDLATFVEANNMQFWQQQAADSARFLSDLKTRQAKLEGNLRRLQTLTPDQLLNTVRSSQQPTSTKGSNNEPSSGAGSDMAFNNEMYMQYVKATQDLIDLESTLAERKEYWKPAHPKYQRLVGQIEDLKRRIEIIKKLNADATADHIVALEAELKSNQESISVWEKKVAEAGKKDAEYQALSKEVERLQNLEETFRTASLKLGSTSGLSSGIPQVISKATPAYPVPKGVFKHLCMGLIGGLVVGGLILFFLDRNDDRVSSSSEILEHFQEPILAQIPNVSASRGESGLPLITPEDERYTYAEAFRSLRSSLIFMPNGEELKSLLVTSAIPNEGKSTIASNLAITMAAAGARVLLVDADLRRGDLASLFDADGRLGLSNILRGEVPWRNVVQSTRYDTLSLIPRGPVTNQSGELLLRPQMQEALREMKEEYDLVLFNTAPILATDDTPTVAPHFDGTLMVVRAQFTSARLTHQALSALYQRQVTVLGLILNCISEDMPDYYYYRYPKYYAA